MSRRIANQLWKTYGYLDAAAREGAVNEHYRDLLDKAVSALKNGDVDLNRQAYGELYGLAGPTIKEDLKKGHGLNWIIEDIIAVIRGRVTQMLGVGRIRWLGPNRT